MLMTDIRHDRSRTHLMSLADSDSERLVTIFNELINEADEQMAVERITRDRVRHELSCDMRYEGQAYEINVLLGTRNAIDPTVLRTAFDDAHARLYGQSSPKEPVEIVNFRVGVIGKVDHIALPRIDASSAIEPDRRRPVLFSTDDGWIDCPVYDRGRLGAGTGLTGPAIIEDQGTSIPLPPGYEALVDSYGAIHVVSAITPHPAVTVAFAEPVK